MKTIKDVQDEVRRIGVEVLAHNDVGSERVGAAIIALNQLTVDLAPLVAEAHDFQEVREHFMPSGSETRADDPRSVRVRFLEFDYAVLQAALSRIRSRREV